MRSLLVLCFVLFVFTSAKADPFVITSGTANLGVFFGANMNVAGDGFTANLHGSGFATLGCSAGCSAGSLISLGGSTGAMGPTDVGGNLTVNGVVQSTAPSGVAFMIFSGPLVSVPTTEDDSITLTSPFHMNAEFPVLGQFVGDGLATIVLHRIAGTSGFNGSSVSYVFTSPVPEPATLFLFSIGIAGVGIKKLRKYS